MSAIINPRRELDIALATAGLTLTNQPNTLEMLTTANPGLLITQDDLSNFTQVMLSVRVFTASASGNSPRVILRYYTSASTTATDWLDIGTSEVSSSMSSAGVIESGWINLAAGAKIANCYIAPLTTGGNGTADPLIALIRAKFR